jgi:hypothetical protein
LLLVVFLKDRYLVVESYQILVCLDDRLLGIWVIEDL